MKRLPVIKLIIALAVLAACPSVPSALAASATWNATPSSGNFNAGNWTTGANTTYTVLSADSLFFGTSTTTTLNNDLSGATFAGFTFNSGASAYTISGSSFTLSGGITNSSSNLQTINNDITLSSASHTFTATSGQLVLGGNIGGTINGSVTVGAAANKTTLGGTNNIAFTGGTFLAVVFNGSTDITGSTTLDGGSGSNNGGFVLDSNIGAGNTSTLTIANGGTFHVKGSTAGAANTTPNSLVGQQSGTGVLNVGATDKSTSGTLTVDAGTGLVFGNSGGNGILNVNSGTATINRGSIATTTTFTDTRLIMMGKDNNGSTGTINLNGGTLATDRQFVRDGSTATGAGTANFVFNGGALKALGTQTDWLQSTTATSAGQNQGATGGTVNGAALALSSVTTTAVSTIDPNGFSVAINSPISGVGGFNINSSTGTGTLTFGGSNSYTGATSVSAGTLALSGTGRINSSSGIAINGSGAKFLQTSSVASTPAITLTQGTLDGTGTVGAVTVGAGTGGIVANGNGATTAFTLGSLTFSGTGNASLRIAGGSTFSSPALAVTGALTLSGGAGSVTVGLTPTSALTNGTTYQLISYGGSFTGNASTDFSIAPGVLSGRQSGAFASTAASNGFITLTVSGDSPVWSGASGSVLVEYPQNTAPTTGNLALKTGHTATDFWTNDALEFNDTYNVGAGDVAVTQATVDIQGGATNAGGIAASAITFNNSAIDYSITSSVGKGITAGSVTKSGTGAVTISTSNSYSGATTLNSGRMNINNASAIGTGALVIVSGTIDNTSGSAITLSGNNSQSWNGDFSFGGSNDLNLGTGAVTLGASRTVTTNGSGNLTIGGVIGGSGFGLTKAGTGTLVLNGANTFNGGFAINGGTVRAGNNTALGASTNALSFGAAGNGKLQVNGNSIAVASINGDSTATIENSNATNGTLTDSNTSNDTFAGTIQDGSAGTLALVKNGSNTLTLSGNNSYSGGTTISAGTLSVGNNNALGTGAVAFNGGTLANTSDVTLVNNFATSSASAAGTITASGGAMVINGNITGGAGLILNPTNKITLAGVNSFGTSLSGAGEFIVNNGTGGVDITGSTTVGTGNTTAFGGNLAVGGTTTVTVQSGGALSIVGSTNVAPPNSIIGFNAAGTSTLLVNGGTFTVGANTGFVLGNANASAVGVLTISSGTATINRGTVGTTGNASDERLIMMGKDNNGATGTINLNGGTLATDRQFVRDGSSSTGSGIANFVFGGGTLKALGTQTDWLQSATATSAGQNQGATGGTVDTAALALSSVTTTAVSTIDSNSFSVGVNNAISGAGGFNIIDGSGAGTGVVTFGGASAYTGATNVNSGKLVVSGSLIGTSAVNVASGATLQVTGVINTAAAMSLSGNLRGSGTVGDVTVNAGGRISASTSNLTTGALSLSGTSTFALSLNSALGTTSKVTASSLSLTDIGNTAVLTITDTGFDTALAIGTKFAFLDYTGAGPGNKFSYTGMVNGSTGTFVLSNGDQITLGSNVYTINYADTDNSFNAVSLTTAAVPEPQTWAMMVGGLGMLSFWQRSRRKAA